MKHTQLQDSHLFVGVFLLLLAGIGLALLMKNSKGNTSVSFTQKGGEKIGEPEWTPPKRPDDKLLPPGDKAPETYLKETKFDMHTFSTPQYISSSLCNHDVLFPINGLGVEYGSKFPAGCKCDHFLQPP